MTRKANRRLLENIGAADCETDPFKYGRIPKPFIWGLYINEQYYEFEKTIDFINFVRDEEWTIYAHNGGKFDWHFVLQECEIKPSVKIIAGRIAEFQIGKCTFRDSYNILPIPLAAYQKDEIDYALFEKETRYEPETWKAIRAYLKSDCVYLHELVTAFVSEYGFNITLASTALKVFNQMSNLKTPRTNLNYFERISPYYFGGRVQAFKTGTFEKDFYYVDINSAYPYAMMYDHAYGNKRTKSRHLPDEKDVKIFVTLKCKSNGHFPVRLENGSLSFPDDGNIYEFKVTGHEYYAAEELGLLEDVEIIEVLTFEDSICFANYVEHFYVMKEQATIEKDEAKRLFAKLFMNSLYGKYATNPTKYKQYSMQSVHTAEEFENFNPDYVCATEIGDNLLYERDLYDDELKFLNVATAASITGYVRAFMMRALCSVDTPYYCDTDSIICEGLGDLEIDATKLGAWDIEGEASFCAIAGKKLYSMVLKDGKTKTASKGARLTHDELVEVAQGGEVVWKSDAPTFSISRGIRFNERKIRKTA
ncbi:DNA polymerase type B [Vibrio phage 1.069.O._10N.286.49.F11]|uniref:DNA-directed DNA polymerase n=6 Tax=Autolykiviridae TaxID=2184034 RepID=A0A2I7S835_9VIRU|nr:DNA polymerase [Vibrio phage 1.008.O._10N.286.54.E5]AUR83773.1 DNA polymerase type B [Vibrio phage 1.040.O._10N.286.45.B9]AUR84652.1 DNA polymerase type B [Vibrio phage 1.062.O._10N.286.55.C3]AUR85149.1 DNA polymerase type B [Vibrio phage 1.069.O._10N.286.49.F11]AUR89577.1 DNA polymerase type B [Vibrio phage 1.125.O._10N.286.49.F5]AUS02066.1 DNA polymerase type B [Vibrio phage 2.092.O._10N.286.52.B7]